MTPHQFRKLALALPETAEQSHMCHPDFRVGGKIFATLWTDGETAMVKLTPEEQTAYVAAEPDVFQPVTGAWGRRGCTTVHLPAATAFTVKKALTSAWRSTAPKKLVKESKT